MVLLAAGVVTTSAGVFMLNKSALIFTNPTPPLAGADVVTRRGGAAHVQTRTTVVLSTAWEGRPVTGKEAREPKESPKS